MSFNILSLDGGGTFGVNTAVILNRIQQQNPSFMDKVDLIAGTSIGGIIALALANGVTPAQTIDMFVNEAKNIFSASWSRKAAALVGTRSKYDSTGMTTVLTKYLGQKTLSELAKKVVIQSFQMNGELEWQEKIFHNLPLRATINESFAKIQTSSPEVTAVFAGLATSAAPTYFPSCSVYLDGGLCNNSPAASALAMTQDPTFAIPNFPLSQIKLLSIGRIYAKNKLKESSVDWGYIGWAPRIIDILLTGNVTVTDYQCRQFLGSNYFRVATKIPAKFDGIDEYKDIPDLKTFSEGLDINELQTWVKANW